jgi:hypothetical protein
MSDHLRSLAIELLIGAADATLIYLCYKWYKNDCAAAVHIEVMDGKFSRQYEMVFSSRSNSIF